MMGFFKTHITRFDRPQKSGDISHLFRGFLAVSTILFLLQFLAAADVAAQAPPNQKGVNYDPAGEDCLDWGCPVDASAVAQDIPIIAQLGSNLWVRTGTPVSALLQPPLGMSWNQANAIAKTNLDTVLSAVGAYDLNPLVVVLAWCYTPGSGAGCPNMVTGLDEENNQRGVYQQWLENEAQYLVQSYGVTAIEIGNETNLNAYGEAGGGINPDAVASGWDIPNCQLDDPGATFQDCDSGNVPANLLGRNPNGLCDGSILPDGSRAPNGPPSQDYVNAVRSYVSFLRDSYSAIKTVEPQVTVVMGGISSWHSACFIDLLGVLGGFNYVDAVGFHAYPTDYWDTSQSPAAQAATTVQYLQANLNQFRSSVDPLPIWITEYGFQLGKTGDVASQQQDAQYLQAEWNMLANEGVSGPIMMYAARDPLLNYDWENSSPLTTAAARWGLYEWVDNGTFQPLPAFSAYQGLP